MTIPTLDINMQKRCDLCGRSGTTGSGVCLTCAVAILAETDTKYLGEFIQLVLASARTVRLENRCSRSFLQRCLKIGYAKACHIERALVGTNVIKIEAGQCTILTNFKAQ